VLSAVYIKGFKTFARPVRMPLEGGVTAIIGPNGSGKSNITDAVLFALGEQSPGVLRAGAMGDLIFSGSESLPAAGLAEVTLVLDNRGGEISLPYEEVSLSRRISRNGETEYRVNGSRSRLADVRAVAGEAGIGRHSILRQGSVDAIVAGGPAACRLALEESAGLGVYRRRRVSASRRLERADAQLDQSRQLELELANQLARIEREAVAAREYRELEARFRSLSLAHLYRTATRDSHHLQERLRDDERAVAGLEAAEAALAREDAEIRPRARDAEARLRRAEGILDVLEDALEGLAAEALRAERAVMRLEAAGGREGERVALLARVDEARRRLASALDAAERQTSILEGERSVAAVGLDEWERTVGGLRHDLQEAQQGRDSLHRELTGLATRQRTAVSRAGEAYLDEAALERVSKWVNELGAITEELPSGDNADLTRRIASAQSMLDAAEAQVSRRRGALDAAVEAMESRLAALRERLRGAPGELVRLYEILRPLPGYEAAVEAALGEYGSGVLARDAREGLKLLSPREPVAVRLDAAGIEGGDAAPGVPLFECVEVSDRRYEEAVERLLAGVYVTEGTPVEPPANGYVVVTRDGVRLTRTSVRLRMEESGLSLGARLSAEERRLQGIEPGPGRYIEAAQRDVSVGAERLRRASVAAGDARELGLRTRRAAALVGREAARREAEVRRRRELALEGTREAEALAAEIVGVRERLDAAEREVARLAAELATANGRMEAARADVVGLDERLSQLSHATAGFRGRDAVLLEERERLAAPAYGAEASQAALVQRVASIARTVESGARGRRVDLRGQRALAADLYRRASAEQAELARRGVELAGRLASARATAERSREALEASRLAADDAVAELEEEWGADLDIAAAASEELPEHIGAERQRVGRRLKRFGDVNLLALSQEEGLRERHDFVAAQRADAEEAAGELRRIIDEIDGEIEDRFSQTFGRVREAFGTMVPRMIFGAEGALNLSEEGVEIGLRLGRRGWKPIRVLSGGERSLLALSFLFAVLIGETNTARGAFCILDEAEAALDDVNLSRFLAVVDSHRKTGQFVLVTHQKRTMASADVLYGITQDATGATAVVSKRLRGD
jgi:chromosome segregation protein